MEVGKGRFHTEAESTETDPPVDPNMSPNLSNSVPLDNTLERVFGAGATRLAEELDRAKDCKSTYVSSIHSSTPSREDPSNKRLRGADSEGFGDISGIVLGVTNNEGIISETDVSKKPKLGGDHTEELDTLSIGASDRNVGHGMPVQDPSKDA